MGAPGKDLVPYVAGVFGSDVQAMWQVDNGLHYLSKGSVGDYFGSDEFSDLPVGFIDEVGSGRDHMRIATPDGKKSLDVGLKGARTAVASFNACFKDAANSDPVTKP